MKTRLRLLATAAVIFTAACEESPTNLHNVTPAPASLDNGGFGSGNRGSDSVGVTTTLVDSTSVADGGAGSEDGRNGGFGSGN